MKKKVLIVGFYGMSDIGSEIRLKRIVKDLTSLHKNLEITVLSLLKYKMGKIKNVSYINFGNISINIVFKAFKILKGYDIILIGEGIPFNNFVGLGFLLYFMPILFVANFLKKKTICYAIDIDKLNKLESYFLKKTLNKSCLVTVRSPLSAKRMKDMGVKKDIYVTSDPVCLYNKKKIPLKYKKNKSLRIGVGFINHFCFPINIKFIGKKEDLYSYPYYYTYKNKGKLRYKEFVKEVSNYFNELLDEFDMEIYFFAMDYKVDFHINDDIKRNIKKKNKVKLISYRTCNFKEINGIFSTLDLIISSRLHALILGSNFYVPPIAIRVDERFDSFMDYIGLKNLCVNAEDEDFIKKLDNKIRYILVNKNKIKIKLKKEHKKLLLKAKENREIIKEFLN